MIVSPLLPLAEKRIRFSRFPASDVSSPAHTFARTRTLHRSSDGFFLEDTGAARLFIFINRREDVGGGGDGRRYKTITIDFRINR